MLLLIWTVILNLNFVLSYPYDPVYHSEYDVDHEAAIADIDHQIDKLAYEHEEYEKGTGDAYDDSHYSLGGGKGDKGYKSYRGNDKGRVGHYGAEGHKNNYNEKGGHNSGHNDAANYYKDNHSLVKGSKGSDYAVSDNFNKGSKTKGFHNVHFKEEYQKNRKFYDEANKHGYSRRYGDFGAALLAAAGGSAKGNQYDSGYKNGNYGRSGYADKGSLYDDLKKYAAANGYDGYYGNYADYGRSGHAGHGNAYGNYDH